MVEKLEGNFGLIMLFVHFFISIMLEYKVYNANKITHYNATRAISRGSNDYDYPRAI